LQNKDYAIKRD